MGSWLLSIIDQLRQNLVSSTEDNGRKMASTLTILFCFYKLIPKPLKLELIPYEYIAEMLSFLGLKPDLEHHTCTDLDFVYSLLPAVHRKTVSEAVIGFSLQLSHNKLLESPQWLFAVPFVHFLRGTSKPFQKQVSDPRKIVFVDKSLGLDHVRRRTNEKHYG